MNELAFIPGNTLPPQEPLARFLPPIPTGIIGKWLTRTTHLNPEHALILDPFCTSPRLTIEAARAGFRVLVTANNPILRFLLELYATPLSEEVFQAGLAELGTSLRGDERLEPHIRSLYTISCQDCLQKDEVDAFIWDREQNKPLSYISKCSYCGSTGEKKLLPEDADRIRSFSSSNLHRARALERVLPLDDPDRSHVEEALSVYLPRAVYVLFTLINRMDALNISGIGRTALQALILIALDAGNSLWGYPSERSRPRQLTTPARFRENNLWKALEDGIYLYKTDLKVVPVTIWPEVSDQTGSICIFEGPLRDLASHMKGSDSSSIKFDSIISVLPRPNQAFWTLSALWSGWLWGKEKVTHFKSVLRRRRYDWAWHYAALLSSYRILSQITDVGTTMFSLTGETESGLLTSAIAASGGAGFSIQDIAIRDDQTQFNSIFSPKDKPFIGDYEKIVSKSISEFLVSFGQPAHYMQTMCAGLKGLDQAGCLQESADDEAGGTSQSALSDIQAALRNGISYRGGLLRYGGSSDALENSLFWLKDEPVSAAHESILPFSDRLEIEIVNQLVKKGKITFEELESVILSRFQGLMTPNNTWIQVIIDSYASELDSESGILQLRQEDRPENRKKDLQLMVSQLSELATQYGYAQSGELPLLWKDSSGSVRYWFYTIASAVFSNIVLAKGVYEPSPPSQSIIVLPGGRANLVSYKIQKDPRLGQKCQLFTTDAQLPQSQEIIGWRFLKSRHLRRLIADPKTPDQSFDKLLALDPLTFATPQMRMF